MSNISAISWREQITFRWDDNDIYFVLNQHAKLKLKQLSKRRHVPPLRHIFLTLSHTVFASTPKYCVLGWEPENTIFIVFALIRPGLKYMIYRTQGKHDYHYTIDAVLSSISNKLSDFLPPTPGFYFHEVFFVYFIIFQICSWTELLWSMNAIVILQGKGPDKALCELFFDMTPPEEKRTKNSSRR